MKGKSSGFKNEGFYTAERTKPAISHSDFAKESNFGDFSDTADLVEFLLEQDFEKTLNIQVRKNNELHIETSSANKLFMECYSKYKDRIDTVECFSTIIDFFKFDEIYFFNKLVKKIRVMLIHDLGERMGTVFELETVKLDKNHTQHSFANLFDKKAPKL